MADLVSKQVLEDAIRRAYVFGYREGHRDTLSGDVDRDLLYDKKAENNG